MPDNNQNPQQQQPDPMLSAIQARTATSPQQQAPSGRATSTDPMLDAVMARQREKEAGEAGKWSPSENDMVAEIQTPDGQPHLIHADDLAEAKRRNPNIKVVSQPQVYRDYARGRMYDNWTRAMSGQPMERPEDQAETEKGKEAGTYAGAATLATGALGGLLAPGVQVAQEASIILGREGQPIIKEVVKDAPSVIGEIISALPKKATIEQALKIAQIAYKLGIGAGGAAYLWHELFGTK